MSMRTNNKIVRRFSLFVVVLIAVGAVNVVTISRAGRVPSLSITITNNTTGPIRHVYLSPVDQNNWGPDQLNDSAIPAGGSATLNISCDQPSIRVIAEDQNGCFLYQIISCAENQTWTITSDASPDCG